jgi:hypothetical protein
MVARPGTADVYRNQFRRHEDAGSHPDDPRPQAATSPQISKLSLPLNCTNPLIWINSTVPDSFPGMLKNG